jgi:hypothetical protein
MGSSNKGGGGSGSSTYDYYGTIQLGLGEGPIDALVSILEDGKEIWHGPLRRAGASNPSLITIAGRGKLWLWFGSAGQGVDSRLAQYDAQPPYANQSFLVADDFLLGLERTTSPNWEFIVQRSPNQTLVTGASAGLDSNAQCNVVAFTAELATAATGLGLPNSKFYAPSWQAVADALNTDDMRSLFAVSPLLTSQATFRDVLMQLGQAAQIWARRRDDGTIELGRWTPPADPTTVPLFTADDLTADLEYDTGDMEGLPTEYTVGFTDSSQFYKNNSVRVPDLAAAVVTPVPPPPENIDHPEIMFGDQARRYAAEYMRQRRGGALTGTAKLRRSKAIAVRPGDYFRLDIDTIPGGAGLAQLMRCTGRTFGPTGPVSLDFQSEPNSAPVPFVQPWGDQIPNTGSPVAPVFAQRTISLPPDSNEDLSITPLVARPADGVTGVQVLYDVDLDAGTFGSLGVMSGFALPVKLAAAVAANAATVRVNTFAEFAAGARADRERWLLETGAGATESEARNDALLLILLKKNASTGVLLASGALQYAEVLAIDSIAMPAADTWDLGVLRGRLGTTALAFNSGGFPDAWTNYEGWIISGANLARFQHPDLLQLMVADSTGYLRLRPFSRFAQYDPAIAHEAGLQATDTWTTWPFWIPEGYDVPAASRTFRQSTAPTGRLRVGDLWYDIDDGNRPYRWDGSQWVDISDTRIDGYNNTTQQLLDDTSREIAALIATSQDHVADLQRTAQAAADATTAEIAARGAAIASEASARAAVAADLASEVTTRSNAIAAEIAARGQAITSEASTRAAAILAEAASRTSDVSTVTASLLAEVTDRVNAVAGEASTRSAAIIAETSARQTDVDSLASELSALVAGIGDNSAVLIRTAQANADAVSAEVTARTTLAATVATNTAAITSESTARSTADSSLSTRIDNLVAASGGDYSVYEARISAEETARASADTAEATARTTLASTINTSLAGKASTSDLSSEATSRSNADSAETTSRQSADATLTSAVAGRVSQAAYDTQVATLVSADSAETTARTTAISNLTNTVNGKAAQASLDAEASTRATDTDALAQELAAVVASFGDNTAAITRTAQASADATSAETNARTTAISNLTNTVNGKASQAALDSESTTRAGADTAETTARQTAISNLTTTVSGKASQAALDSESTTRATADTSETNARTTAISNLTDTVNGKAAQASLDAEASTRATADTSETSARTAADSTLTTAVNAANAAITSEATTRATADTSETNARTTAISNLTSTVNGKVSQAAYDTQVATLVSADSAETTARQTAISSLTTTVNGKASQAALDAESSTRSTANTAETSARTAADSTLTTAVNAANAAITSEATTRATADTSETNARTTAISNLTSTVNGKVSQAAYDTQVATLVSADSAETTARQTAISNLTTTVNGKASQASLDSETSTRTTADAAQATSISSLATTVNGMSGSVSLLAGAYISNGAARQFWAVQFDNNGRVTGMELVGGSSSPRSSLVLQGVDIRSNDYVAGAAGFFLGYVTVNGVPTPFFECQNALIRGTLNATDIKAGTVDIARLPPGVGSATPTVGPSLSTPSQSHITIARPSNAPAGWNVTYYLDRNIAVTYGPVFNFPITLTMNSNAEQVHVFASAPGATNSLLVEVSWNDKNL